jgi:hypothetical protein
MTTYDRLRYSLYAAAICLMVGCIPPPGAYPSEPPPPGWEQGPEDTSSYREEDGQDGQDGQDRQDRQASSGNSNWWLCTAEGSMGTAYGDGPWSYSTERAHGNGPTRDDAYIQALDDCNSMMSMASSLAISSGAKRDGGSCTVSECIGPGQ